MSESGKIALITGAGSGIGRRTAFALWNAGWSVALAGRREHLLRETLAEGGVAAERGLVQACDVSDEHSVAALFARVEETYGRLDLLFNNAGVSALGLPLDELDAGAWRRVLDINVTGVFLCTQAAFRLMKRQRPRGGRIINNGSLSAQRPRPMSAPYTASKHALTGLTRSTSLDGREWDIVCGQIDIGNAATEMTRRMEQGVIQADGQMRVEPTMDADHVADAVRHMAELPLDVNVPFITVMANRMPFTGRG